MGLRKGKTAARHAMGAVVAAGLIGSLAACGGATDASDGQAGSDGGTPVLKVSDFPVQNLAPLYAGVAGTAFTDHGIDVQPTTISGAGSTIIPALQSGDIDVAASNVVSVLQSRAAGNDIKCFAGITRRTPDSRGLALLASSDSGATAAQDLAGASIAVNALAGGNELIVRAWLDEHDVDPDTVRFVAVAQPQMPQVLNSGEVDAAIVDDPYTAMATSGGANVIDAHPHTAIAEEPIFDCWVATDKTIEERGEDLKLFAEAYQSQADELNADRAYLEKTLVDEIGFEAEIAGKVSPPQFDTAVSAEDLQIWVDAGEQYGILPSGASAEDTVVPLGG